MKKHLVLLLSLLTISFEANARSGFYAGADLL